MSDAICRMRIDAQGLPGRTTAVIAGERGRFGQAVEDVLGADPDLHIDPVDDEAATETLPADVLLEALGGPPSDRRTTAAAFVAGRCTTDDDRLDHQIRDAVAAVTASIDRSERLGRQAHTFVEAVMATGLLGDAATAVELFTAQLTHPEFRSVADSRAAGYLAQLGVPIGYPVLLEDLHQTGSAHVRMRSLEDLLPFVSFDGEQVGDVVVDVGAELRRAAADDPAVAEQSRRLAAQLDLDLGESSTTA